MKVEHKNKESHSGYPHDRIYEVVTKSARMKLPSGGWVDAVIYRDGDEHFVREKSSFEQEFREVPPKKEGRGVALFGYTYLYQNGDPVFYQRLSRMGLTRGNMILTGLKHKIIVANKHEYFVTDTDDFEKFCERWKIVPTYTIDEFVGEVKLLIESIDE